jgi:hypothetical protein
MRTLSYEEVYEAVLGQLDDGSLWRSSPAVGDRLPIQPEGATDEQFAEVCGELGFNRMQEAGL